MLERVGNDGRESPSEGVGVERDGEEWDCNERVREGVLEFVRTKY